MTALNKDRKSDQLGTPDIVDPQLLSFPVAAATTIFGGSMVATDAAGNAVPVTASTAIKVWGRCERQVVNTVAAGLGAVGDLFVTVRQGVFGQNIGAGVNALTKADAGKIVYASDDNTVNKTDGAGLWPAAGKFFGIDPVTGQAMVGLGMPSLYDVNDELIDGGPNATVGVRARNVVLANVADLTAYVVASDANLNDAVLNVAGDVVLLVAQTTPAQNGLYVVGTVATGTAPLTRLDVMPLGAAIIEDQYNISVSEGTKFGHTKWFNALSVTVGAASPDFYPESVTLTQALVAGAITLTSVPILSATKSQISMTRSTANTCTATTGGYVMNGNPTPGPLGTASAPLMAAVAAGTLNNADISSLHITVTNR